MVTVCLALRLPVLDEGCVEVGVELTGRVVRALSRRCAAIGVAAAATMATTTIARMKLRITFSPVSETDLRPHGQRVLRMPRDEIVLVEHGPLEIDDVFEIGREIPVQAERPGVRLAARTDGGQPQTDRVRVDPSRVIARADLQRAEVPGAEVEIVLWSNGPLADRRPHASALAYRPSARRRSRRRRAPRRGVPARWCGRIRPVPPRDRNSTRPAASSASVGRRPSLRCR